MKNTAYIVLADGSIFRGRSFGAAGCTTGEAVFTTGMTGYLETLTDPSYFGQIVMQTFPLIGNYGIIPDDFESAAPHVKGYIVREWCRAPSNFRCAGDLDSFLKKHGIVGLCCVDTRTLTKIIRESGVMNARIIAPFRTDIESQTDVESQTERENQSERGGIVQSESADARAREEAAAVERVLAGEKDDPVFAGMLAEIRAFRIENAVASVTGAADAVEKPAELVFAESAAYRAVPVTADGLKVNDAEKAMEAGRGKKVVLWDFGAKANIRRELLKRGLAVVTMKAGSTCDEILAQKPDGVLLSNGPGDPEENTAVIAELKKLTDSGVPVFGICLGHQLLALARGAKTAKLKYGHRGANQPVKELATGRVYISSQNHGYAVVSDSLPEHAALSFVNTNDGTCEGVDYTDFPGFSVQFHPEASAGPLDTAFLFDRFIAMMNRNR